MLMRAPKPGSRSALLVGTTYDPGLLRQIGADGPMADAAQAALYAGKGMGRTDDSESWTHGAIEVISTRRVGSRRQSL